MLFLLLFLLLVVSITVGKYDDSNDIEIESNDDSNDRTVFRTLMILVIQMMCGTKGNLFYYVHVTLGRLR